MNTATKLPHTGMIVPDPAIVVSSVQVLGRPFSWSAVVRRKKDKLGLISNEGEATQFFPVDPKRAKIMKDFVAACRDADGPLDEETVLDNLVDEYEHGSVVRRADRTGHYVFRFWDDLGIPSFVNHIKAPTPAPIDYQAGLAYAQQAPISDRPVRGEIWMGSEQGWVEFFNRSRS